MRLNKYIAECGICSRRAADELIKQGKVKINGRIAGMGEDVSDGDEVIVGDKRLVRQEKKVVLAYYKPVGVTCTEKDAHAKKKITDMIDYPVRVTYAGRLDKDSEGLILLSNDGNLIHAMMQGANRHEKEYLVKVDREITQEFIHKMEAGIFLKELNLTTRPCRIEQTGPYTFKIILTQGVNRQIRRMCASLRYNVKKLKRIRVLNISAEGIEYGKYREITGDELARLYEMVEKQL